MGQIFRICKSEMKLCETQNSKSVVSAVVLLVICCETTKTGGMLRFETSFSLYKTEFDVIGSSCMYCVAYLSRSIVACTRWGKQVHSLLDWRLQICTVHVILTKKRQRVLSSFVVVFVYDLMVGHCSRHRNNMKTGTTWTGLWRAFVGHSARLTKPSCKKCFLVLF
jgi:hypothetical protein